MIKNYLKIAFRNLFKYLGFSITNIFGLAIGLACCFLIALFIQFELSYENMHDKNVYRYIPRSVNDSGILQMQTWTPPGFTPAMDDYFEEITHSSRYTTLDDEPLIKKGDENLPPLNLSLGDQDFFEIFNFKLLRGEADKVLSQPYSIVISSSIAEKFFPNSDPIGQIINYDNQFDLNITGVFEDLPANTHLQFSYIIPFETLGDVYQTQYGFPKDKFLTDLESWNYTAYFKLEKGVNPEQFQAKIDKHFTELRNRTFNPDAITDWLQPIDEIHFTQGIKGDVANGDKNTVYIFSAIALFILIIACFNFMNLSTARALRRAKEVGVRKVMGAQKHQLVYQFLGETFILTSIALVASLIFLEILIPWFNSTMGFSLSSSYLDNYKFLAVLLVAGVITAIVAGGYPAFYLSSFEAAKVLKDTDGRAGKSTLRKVLTVFQFMIAGFLIIGTFTVIQQMNYLNNKDLGFDKDQIIYVHPNSVVAKNMDVLMDNFRKLSPVVSVTRSNGVPGFAHSHWSYAMPEYKDKSFNINTLIVDYDFVDTYDLEIVEGRNISREYATDSAEAYLINETAAKQLMIANPIGTNIKALDGHPMGKIVGVVKDFHYRSLHQPIQPLVMRHDPRNAYTISVKLAGGKINESIALLEQEWKKIAPDYPFDYAFLDDNLESLYQAENNTGTMLSAFSGLAILIACMGLLGLTSFMTEQRKKEIGVRKVLGASVTGIISLLTKDFAKLVLVSFLISIPLAWYALGYWLNNFAYKVEMNPLIYISAGVVLLLIAMLTVSYQSYKAASSNPVDTLRSE
ncbi:ABC transporter permease [Fulvivirga lutea]|uniref:ABC transporter permease n=1 Tax=Fulvivirga lutea TaxID=2810512 RepID=A0A974ZZF3_9BACT|nr:ABC transporter permease [Fulvivirga lutea]QSE96036.1 ABC transporter permease [Fulvivirga lutea]